MLVPITFRRPRRLIVGGYLGGAFVTAANSQLSYAIYGGGVEGGLNLLVGINPFPQRQGGNWHAVEVRALAGVYGAGVVYPQTGAGMLMTTGSGMVGYEFVHLGKVDAREFKQKGIGVRVAGRLGFQWSDIIQKVSTSGTDPTIGAEISMILPKFNAQTGRYKAGLLTAGLWALPGTGLTFYTIGGGEEF